MAYSDAFGGFWSLLKYDDIERAAKDYETFSAERRFVLPEVDTGGTRWKPLQADPPEHFKYRSVIQPFFARGRVRGLEDRIRDLAIRTIEESGQPTEADLCEIFTLPLTGSVLCMFLGFDRSDWGHLKEWTSAMNRAAATGDREGGRRIMGIMSDYITAMRDDRRQRPRAADEDLMSAVLAAQIDGEPIADADIDGIFKLMMTAGHETTSHGLGNTLRHLSEHPKDQDTLRRNPSMIPGAIEEVLRYWGPVGGLVRTATRDVEIRGTQIRAEETVALMWASAGRDEDVHEDAGTCVIDRANTKHLAFGAGVHRCIGADLARVQMRVALEELLRRTETIRPHGTPRRRGWPSVGTTSLPVTIEWAS